MNTDDLKSLLRQATGLTGEGRLREATQAIQRALGALPSANAFGRPPPEFDPMVIDMPSDVAAPQPSQPTPERRGKAPGTDGGQFIGGAHTHASRTLRYKLYVPPHHEGRRLPLVVMLHGCTQDPDDFALGTGMNALAHAQGCFVLYPAQAQEANPQRCWNWFKHSHQTRGRGEPAVIAAMTQAVMQAHGIDPDRVYIAGLSAGGAMAAIVAAAYPDIYAAAGVHSGLPIGAAGSMPEAFAAMKGNGKPSAPALDSGQRVPTIVFHGDQDQTVHPRNGEQVIAAAAGMQHSGGGEARRRAEQGTSARGRRYTRAIHEGAAGEVLAEHWVVHGSGHAWSGGQASGSYTDPSGPDASGEMLRFFFEHPKHPQP